MKPVDEFHVLTVGSDHSLKENLWDRINAKSTIRFSQLLHPKHTSGNRADSLDEQDVHFFCNHMPLTMPMPDHELLASLEQSGVPTIHNMIRGDRVVSKLSYIEGLMYATFLTRRLIDLISEIKPSVIIGAFDALHSGLALAVAKRMNIPWFALNFSVLPRGLARFCDQMVPSSAVHINTRTPSNSKSLAEKYLQQFESRRIQADAYIAPPRMRMLESIRKIPQRMLGLQRIYRKSSQREFLKFVEYRSGHSVWAALLDNLRAARARKALSKIRSITAPPASRYVFFGLHFQPESSIDVWAPFFSNQIWVIELLSRSIPPTHKLLVKIHKSDVSNYSRAQLEHMMSFPGVEIVAPFADTYSFIQNADLVIVIQSTVGLEAALLGKPVIMLGDSLVNIFPSASPVGKIQDLPVLIEKKLEEVPPNRDDIVRAYASYLAPFQPACHNNWRRILNMEEIDNCVELMENLRSHLSEHTAITRS